MASVLRSTEIHPDEFRFVLPSSSLHLGAASARRAKRPRPPDPRAARRPRPTSYVWDTYIARLGHAQSPTAGAYNARAARVRRFALPTKTALCLQVKVALLLQHVLPVPPIHVGEACLKMTEIRQRARSAVVSISVSQALSRGFEPRCGRFSTPSVGSAAAALEGPPR